MPFANERIEKNKELLSQEFSQDRDSQLKSNTKTVARASRFRFDPSVVMSRLRSRIIGQEQALTALEDMLITIKADFGADHRPLSTMFFLGPTGVGKTETVRLIAESILGSANKLCRIDMNTLAQEHYSASISGAPPGYVGSKEGTSLLSVDHIRGSYSEPGILLLDEIEKASTEVIRAILNIFDTGKLVLSSGTKELDFTNCLIFMTSNIGAEDLKSYLASYKKGWKRWLKPNSITEETILDSALHKRFDTEFLNRIDQIIRFNRLGHQHLDSLINIELDNLNRRLTRRDARIDLSPAVKEYLQHGYDKRFGARDISRRIRQELEPALARAMNIHMEKHLFKATLVESQIVVNAQESS